MKTLKGCDRCGDPVPGTVDCCPVCIEEMEDMLANPDADERLNPTPDIPEEE